MAPTWLWSTLGLWVSSAPSSLAVRLQPQFKLEAGPPAARSPEADAQFLIQATFGPTRDSLKELAGMSYQQWIAQQMSLPAELHRAFFRKHVNPRHPMPMPAGMARSRCAAGSRWNRFAFENTDRGSLVEARDGRIWVKGVLRTDVDPANRAWANLSYSGFICNIDESVGGQVQLTSQPNCAGESRALTNPAVWLLKVPATATTAARFRTLRTGVLLMSEPAGNVTQCALPEVVQVQNCEGGGCRAGDFARHSLRLELLQNTPDSPAVFAGTSATLCPTVRRNRLNVGSCRLQAACEPGSTPVVRIPLTPEGLQRISAVSGRLVYQVAGLPATQPPCRVLSRWAAMDCRSTNCVASNLTAAQVQPIQSALQAATGDLRDITATCDRVPAGAIVQVGTAFFRHVHPEEGNVYDFTDWAVRYFGSTAAVARFVERNGTVLRYPSTSQQPQVGSWASASTQATLGLLGRMGESKGLSDMPVSLQVPAVADAFEFRTRGVYFEVCGSPGEVANDPIEGHWYSFKPRDFGGPTIYTDREYEVLNPSRWQDSTMSRVNVWFEKAVNGRDQLRQRMAWALSQIFVQGDDGLNEAKMHYYDIFVRHAFGNFRDLLREVTYSPQMGKYLTYLNNKAFHVQETYPDENYAREITQLFTIGLWLLHPNGTKIKGPTGEALPTFGSLNIPNFARVFTGFGWEASRSNIEHSWGRNWIDPMVMQVDLHDRFPKIHLSKGYLGDGYPLCTDLPTDAFLQKGARYEFVGYRQPSRISTRQVFSVAAGTALYRALCQPGNAEAPSTTPCSFRPVVELPQTLKCEGQECSRELPRFVSVGGGFYEYTPPSCVRLFFFNGRQLIQDGRLAECENPETTAAGIACCTPGSPLYPTQCALDTADVRFATAEARCASVNMTVCGVPSGNQRRTRCQDKLWSPGPCKVSVAIDADGTVSPQTDAAARMARFNVIWTEAFPEPSVQSCTAAGCSYSNETCICEASVQTTAAFDRVPSEAEVQQQLFVGAFPPTAPCTVCKGPVRAYSPTGQIDARTVFEANGKFWRNVRSTVQVGNRYAFRNPPNFMVPRAPLARDALNEVDALLEYLTNHPNTPVFTSYRLIQRFGNSNPSPRYLEDVVEAFRSGAYGGQVYSGRYGDLGATLAAILLHPEARADVAVQSGALREPILKLAHVLRSLEYQDRQRRPLSFDQRLDAMGQMPMASPTVFNFFHFNFQPSEFLMNETRRPLVAPEYEIMDSSRFVSYLNGLTSIVDNTGLSNCNGGFGVAFSGQCQQGDFLAARRWNLSSVDTVVSELNLLLTGGRLSQPSRALVRGTYQQDFGGPFYGAQLGARVAGSATFQNLTAALAAALTTQGATGVTQGRDGLFTLRTGASPQPSTGEVSWVKKATTSKLAAAQTALVLTPEFNVVGGLTQSRPAPQTTVPAGTGSTAKAPKPYKAIVQLYLAGGADTFQLLVPQNCPLYKEYVEVRQSIALTPSQLLQVSSPNQVCPNFGIHNKLPFLAQLYRDGDAAFVSNVGPLAEPLLGRQEYLRGGKKRCVGVFSHEDQTQAAQTLFCQSRGSAYLGVGGRLADTLSAGADGLHVASFSLAGNQVWGDGYRVKPSSLNADKGVERIQDVGSIQSVVANISSQAYDSVYSDIYVRGLADTVRQSEEIGKILDAVRLKTTFPTQSRLQRQFQQVARLIAARRERKAERDLFFVQIGGFDTHKEVNPTLDMRFTEINDALSAFTAEMKAQGTWGSTVVYTASDFGRTLTPNDNGDNAGTDHGWAGNHVVMGGAVRGSRVLNQFPETLQQGSTMDVGRGRLIPGFPYESYMVPIAQWMGLPEQQISAVFPNLGNFNRSAHIIGSSALFKA